MKRPHSYNANGDPTGQKDYQWEDYSGWMANVAYLLSAYHWGDFSWVDDVSPSIRAQECEVNSEVYSNMLNVGEGLMSSKFDVPPDVVPFYRVCGWALELGQ